jgi:hypothetical protein
VAAVRGGWVGRPKLAVHSLLSGGIAQPRILEQSANLPAPGLIAKEITDDLEAALEQFEAIAEDLK